MKLDIYFKESEMKEFLQKEGYSIVDHSYSVWDQWGNHDSQGEWREVNIVSAIKKGETPTEGNRYTRVFEEEITNKLKNFLLS